MAQDNNRLGLLLMIGFCILAPASDALVKILGDGIEQFPSHFCAFQCLDMKKILDHFESFVLMVCLLKEFKYLQTCGRGTRTATRTHHGSVHVYF